MIYLDHNATTPVLPEKFEAMRPHTSTAIPESCLHLGLGSRLLLPAREKAPIRTGQVLAQTALSAYSWKER